MRVGVSAWGFTGDNKIENGKEVSTPDGNATYSWAILHELQKRKYDVYWMQKDRDAEAVGLYGEENFSSFSQSKRWDAYKKTIQTHGSRLPELDLLLVEWRFPIEGRNCNVSKESKDYQPDLDRQIEIIDYYLSNEQTRIVIWDLDHKLTTEDELEIDKKDIHKLVSVIETSANPMNLVYSRFSCEVPFVIEDLLQHPMLPVNKNEKISYVGSRYERDDIITKYLLNASNTWKNQVHFYGNWLKTIDECRKLWPNVEYHDRITTKGFRSAYAHVGCCPLLAKKSYLQTGFVTARVFESLLFGTIPVGLKECLQIENYTMLTVGDGYEMSEVAKELSDCSLNFRRILREENAHRIRFMDSKHFVDLLELLA